MGKTKKRLGSSVLDLITEQKKQGEPSKQSKQCLQSKPALRPWAVRLPSEVIQKVKAVAYWERTHVQSIVAEALARHVTQLEEKRGEEYPLREQVA